MKKIRTALLMLCLLLSLTATALAASSQPSVSFMQKSGGVNGGIAYALEIKIAKPLEEDLPVEIKNDANDDIITLTIPAGDTQAAAMIETEIVDKKQKVTYSFVPNDAYKTGSSHTLSIFRLPEVEFYLDVYMANVGQEMTVRVSTDTPSRVVRGSNTYQLRDTDGTLLAEKTWKNGENDLYFKFTITEAMIGRHNFSVWLGDHMVSTEYGYGTVRVPGAKVLSSVEPELPLMSIGMDCMYKDDLTDAVLAVLEDHDVKITFFMAGHFLRNFPDAAKKILDAGHEIATHSDTHADLPTLSPAKILPELYNPIQLAEDILGVTPRLFRPPYGHYNSDVTSIARSEGMEIIRWSSSFGDSSATVEEKKVMRNATTGANYQPGSIALCHLDGAFMPDSLDAALDLIESLELQVVPISALLYASGRELPAEPAGRGEVMVYTNEYWSTWLEREMPELLAQ